MNATGYKLLGYVVWKGGRWYVRRAYLDRLPSTRTVVVAGAGAALALGAATVLARRVLA